MIETIVRILIGAFIGIGAFLSLVTAFGILRLPDVYTRNHAASKSATLGIMFILLGTFLYFFHIDGHFNSRILLGIAFIFLTSPVAGHLISRASYNSGIPLWEKSVNDDLKLARQKEESK